ncbi:uncharacterized protein IL334_006771 [Kwoniella shivajii]|uniref:CD2 antigen cytoplasmic tail-binding protein 2 n=1 Tax=Kwoniella shivajii TaxID=564305 RepID=A0ABZ1D781_9TREE|nr:hypothetical protein IL334_006771 [Kwoniella shivajii]
MPVKRSGGSSSTAPKRTRFASSPPADSPSGSISNDEDDLLEDDLPQGAAKEKQRAKRSLKDTEGYGSDSSNDEEGVVPSRRPGNKEEEDDDVDMFADDVDEKEKEKASAKEKGKGKDKEYMDLNEIEGQEFERINTKNGGNGDEENSDSEEEEMRKNGKEGLDGDMGTDITPFNMKSEMTQGRFTSNGEEYQENEKDPNEKHDQWLTNLDKDEIKKARRAHRERERIEKEKQEKETGSKEKELSLLNDALSLMERGETILESLQRLGVEVEQQKKKEEQLQNTGGKKKSWAERQKERKKLMASEQEQIDPIHTSNPFTNLSNIVSALTTIGHLDVYSLSKESIQRMLSSNKSASNGSRPAAASPAPVDTRQFQYRFSMAYVRNLPEAQRPVEREVFGPFPVIQLKQWRNTGFFGGPACENVELRLAGNDSGSWGSWDNIVDKA